MVSPLTQEDREALCFEAMRLLVDSNLVWSQDFEAVRPALASLFLKALQKPELTEALTSLATRIVKAHG